MVTTTTTYSFKKPTVGQDEDVWGGYLNDSMDLIDDVLDGTTPVTGIDINSGTIDNTVIGGTTAAAGTFTTLTANTSLGVTGNITVSGTVDGRDVAADGAKLDGIESGATADQTKADIDALGIAASTAATLATARNIALTGAVTGNVNFDGSGNVSIATTATSDPTLTLSGDVTGSATFTNLGNATLTATVANDSHTHDGRYYTESESDARYEPINGTILHQGGDITNQNWNNYIDGTEASWNTVVNHSGSNRPSSAYTYGLALSFAEASQAKFQLYAPHNGSEGNSLWYRTGWNTDYDGWAKVWDSSNDGSGSGLDADNLDGYTWTSSGKNVRATEFYADNWFRNYNAGEGLYNEATGVHIYSAATDNVTIKDAGSAIELELQTNNGTRRGTLYANSSNEVGILDSDNSWAIKHVRDSRTEWYINGTEYMELNSQGLFLHDGSLAEDYDALSGTTPTCNVDNGGAFSLTMTGNTTFTFSGAASGYSQGFVLQLTGNGSTVTWPTSVDWAGGTAPDAPASGETDIYVFWTRNGGTTWYGVQSIDAAA